MKSSLLWTVRSSPGPGMLVTGAEASKPRHDYTTKHWFQNPRNRDQRYCRVTLASQSLAPSSQPPQRNKRERHRHTDTHTHSHTHRHTYRPTHDDHRMPLGPCPPRHNYAVHCQCSQDMIRNCAGGGDGRRSRLGHAEVCIRISSKQVSAND